MALLGTSCSTGTPILEYTLETGTPVEDGDPILKLLWGVSVLRYNWGWAFMEIEFQMISKLHMFSVRIKLSFPFTSNFQSVIYM